MCVATRNDEEERWVMLGAALLCLLLPSPSHKSSVTLPLCTTSPTLQKCVLAVINSLRSGEIGACVVPHVRTTRGFSRSCSACVDTGRRRLRKGFGTERRGREGAKLGSRMEAGRRPKLHCFMKLCLLAGGALFSLEARGSRAFSECGVKDNLDMPLA